MSFAWDSVEERERKKLEQEKHLRQFLLTQQEEGRKRRQEERKREIEEAKKLFEYQDDLNQGKEKPKQKEKEPEAKTTQTFVKTVPDFSNFQSYAMPELTMSSLPFNSTALVPSSTDSSFGIKYLEDRLDQERRSREQLEHELRLGKSLISQLSSKIDNMQSQLHSQQTPLRLPENSSTDFVRMEMKKEVEKLNETYSAKLNTLMAEYMSFKSQFNQAHDSENKKHRGVLDEVDSIKGILSSYMSKNSELHQEHVSKENLLMMEQSKSANIPSVVASHSQWIDNFQRHSTNKFAQLETCLTALKNEITRAVENENKAKSSLDSMIKDVALEVSKTIQSRLPNIEALVSSAVQTSKETKEITTTENQKMAMFISEQVKQLYQKVMDNRSESESLFRQKIKNIEEWLSNEQTQAAKREYQMRSEMESMVKQVDENSKQYSAVIKEDVQLKISQSVQALESSIKILEDSTMARIEKLEKVLKAEVDQRIETQKKQEMDLTRLNDSVSILNVQMGALKTALRDESEKVRARTEAIQTNMKDVIQSVASDVSMNRKLLNSLQRNVEETHASTLASIDSDKQLILSQMESGISQLKSALQTVQSGLQEAQEDSKAKDVKIEFIAGDVNLNKQKLALVQSVKSQLDQLDSWKSSLPESLVSSKTLEEQMSTNNKTIAEMTSKLRQIENVVTESNILRTVDLLHEFSKVKTMTQEDHQYMQEQLSLLSSKVNDTISQETFNKVKDDLYNRIEGVEDQQKLTDTEINAIQSNLSTKINQSQWEIVDVHVKNLKDNLKSMSEWVHENANKQSNDVHKLIVDIQQQVSAKQKAQLVQIEEVKESMEKKMDVLSVSVHAQSQRNEQLEQSLSAKLKIQDESNTANIDSIKNDLRTAIKENTNRIIESERHLDVLKQTMAAFIDEKLIPYATKTELSAFDSNIKLFSNEIRQIRDTQRAAFTQLKEDIEFQMRRINNESNISEKQLTSQEITNLRASLRSLQEQFEQKHAGHIQTVHELTEKLRDLELKVTAEETGMELNSGRVQDLASQIRDIEGELRRATTAQPSNMTSRPLSEKFNVNGVYRPMTAAMSNHSVNMSKPAENLEGQDNIQRPMSVKKSNQSIYKPNFKKSNPEMESENVDVMSEQQPVDEQRDLAQ